MFFRDIIGQDDIIDRLRKTVKEGRISHAQLFCENENYGALALAIAYAAYINCPNRTEEDACGVCPSCVKFKKFSHPDLHFIYPTINNSEKKQRISRDYFKDWIELLSNTNCYCTFPQWVDQLDANNKQPVIYVEEADQLLDTLNFKSYESEYKVVIIWLVEKLNYSAAPKLLKILEEPPEKTLFLLISEKPEELLSTIKSRTQALRIPPITSSAINSALKKIYPNSDEDEICRAAQLSEGSWKRAQNQIGFHEDNNIFSDFWEEWVKACYVFDMHKIVSLSESFVKSGREKQKSFFSFALNQLHLFVQHRFNRNETAFCNNKEISFINQFAPYFSNSNIIEFAKEFEIAISHIERNANQFILFTDISLQMMMQFQRARNINKNN